MRGKTFCYVLKPNNVQKERIVIKGDPFGGGNSSQRALLCREEQLLLRFFGEGSRQLKMKWASLAVQGAESAGRLFSTWCSSTCRSTCKLRDLKSPAPILDQGMFCACQV